MLKEYVNAQWEKDTSTYFVDGEGFWSKVSNAEVNGELLPNEAGASSIEIRVRTGDTNNPTKYVPSYHLYVDGIEVILALDETRPPEQRPEYGGSHIGWMLGSFETEDTKLHALKLVCTEKFSGLDDANFYDPSHQKKWDEGYAAGLEAGGGGSPGGGYTQEDLDNARAEGFNEGKTEGLTEGKQLQFEADKAAIVLID
jgi:hypothetical protein